MYIALGIVIALIIIILFSNGLPDYIEEWGEVTGILLIILLFLQMFPYLFNFFNKKQRDINTDIKNTLCRLSVSLKTLHIPLGLLLLGIIILHAIINLAFDSFEFDVDVIMGIITGISFLSTIIFGLLTKVKSNNYHKQHILFSIITLLLAIIHLID